MGYCKSGGLVPHMPDEWCLNLDTLPIRHAQAPRYLAVSYDIEANYLGSSDIAKLNFLRSQNEVRQDASFIKTNPRS